MMIMARTKVNIEHVFNIVDCRASYDPLQEVAWRDHMQILF